MKPEMTEEARAAHAAVDTAKGLHIAALEVAAQAELQQQDGDADDAEADEVGDDEGAATVPKAQVGEPVRRWPGCVAEGSGRCSSRQHVLVSFSDVSGILGCSQKMQFLLSFIRALLSVCFTARCSPAVRRRSKAWVSCKRSAQCNGVRSGARRSYQPHGSSNRSKEERCPRAPPLPSSRLVTRFPRHFEVLFS